ncbi:unnamed protein product [Notodromas monacha]|uniref:Uncharacterized protein n=1 Tax=Notodromas monacha TaxID=399045 RepID=A0A7R9BPX3_9CRUS|nr:unnamed protein product [Notodromas monacha]CAG0919263.1 unnamed protein product [Notodromas monacha]
MVDGLLARHASAFSSSGPSSASDWKYMKYSIEGFVYMLRDFMRDYFLPHRNPMLLLLEGEEMRKMWSYVWMNHPVKWVENYDRNWKVFTYAQENDVNTTQHTKRLQSPRICFSSKFPHVYRIPSISFMNCRVAPTCRLVGATGFVPSPARSASGCCRDGAEAAAAASIGRLLICGPADATTAPGGGPLGIGAVSRGGIPGGGGGGRIIRIGPIGLCDPGGGGGGGPAGIRIPIGGGGGGRGCIGWWYIIGGIAICGTPVLPLGGGPGGGGGGGGTILFDGSAGVGAVSVTPWQASSVAQTRELPAVASRHHDVVDDPLRHYSKLDLRLHLRASNASDPSSRLLQTGLNASVSGRLGHDPDLFLYRGLCPCLDHGLVLCPCHVPGFCFAISTGFVVSCLVFGIDPRPHRELNENKIGSSSSVTQVTNENRKPENQFNGMISHGIELPRLRFFEKSISASNPGTTTSSLPRLLSFCSVSSSLSKSLKLGGGPGGTPGFFKIPGTADDIKTPGGGGGSGGSPGGRKSKFRGGSGIWAGKGSGICCNGCCSCIGGSIWDAAAGAGVPGSKPVVAVGKGISSTDTCCADITDS